MPDKTSIVQVNNILALENDSAAPGNSKYYGTDSSGTKGFHAGFQGTLGVLIVQDQKEQNTQGGTFTAGSWQTRTLNTVLVNTISGASLAENRITLPEGTYLIEASAPAAYTSRHQAVLYSITDSAISLYGTSESNPSTGGIYTQTRSFISGVVTITGTKVFEIQHQTAATGGTSGFGVASNFTTEVYTEVRIIKI
jgi:hypothetical protein